MRSLFILFGVHVSLGRNTTSGLELVIHWKRGNHFEVIDKRTSGIKSKKSTNILNQNCWYAKICRSSFKNKKKMIYFFNLTIAGSNYQKYQTLTPVNFQNIILLSVTYNALLSAFPYFQPKRAKPVRPSLLYPRQHEQTICPFSQCRGVD